MYENPTRGSLCRVQVEHDEGGAAAGSQHVLGPRVRVTGALGRMSACLHLYPPTTILLPVPSWLEHPNFPVEQKWRGCGSIEGRLSWVCELAGQDEPSIPSHSPTLSSDIWI